MFLLFALNGPPSLNSRLTGYIGIPAEVGKLALRDRNHASVVFFSLCNELGCTPGTLLKNNTAKGCYDAIKSVDPSRAVTGNQAWQGPNAVAPGTPIANLYDVMGMSHQSTQKLDIWHAGIAVCVICPASSDFQF